MLLENAPTFGKNVPGRDHHADWFQTIDHPDAHLIAAAPTLFAALDAMVDASAALYKAGRLDAATYLQARDALRKAVGQ
jgi:hypothetical protein